MLQFQNIKIYKKKLLKFKILHIFIIRYIKVPFFIKFF